MRLLKRFAQGVHPISDRIAGRVSGESVGVSLFGVVTAVNTLLFIALQSYILRKLIKPDLISAQVPHLMRKSFCRRAFLSARCRRNVVQPACGLCPLRAYAA